MLYIARDVGELKQQNLVGEGLQEGLTFLSLKESQWNTHWYRVTGADERGREREREREGRKERKKGKEGKKRRKERKKGKERKEGREGKVIIHS